MTGSRVTRARRTAVTTAVAVGLGAALAVGGTAVAVGSDPGDTGDTGDTGRGAGRATEAALAATGGGHANSVERDSENGATWEVEVTQPNGETVDVRLDERLAVVVIESDAEG